jgi:uncharacterized membrane protein
MRLTYLFSSLLFCIILLSMNNNGFWHDEMFTYALIQGHSIYPFPGSVWDNIPQLTSSSHLATVLEKDNFFKNLPTTILHEGHPPFYYLVVKLWTSLFGNTLLNLRLFSAFCSVLAIITVSTTIKQIPSTASHYLWVLAVLTNPFFFYFASEARMYSFGLLLAAISFKASEKINNDILTRNALFYFISSITLIYTHYFGVFLLSTLALKSYMRTGRLKLALFHLLPIITFLPWLLSVQKQLSMHKIHWTDGSLTIIDGILAFTQTIITILSTQTHDRSCIETTVFTILVLFVFTVKRRSIQFKQTALILAFYYLQVTIFDCLFDKHTISIPRYHIFLAPILYHIIYEVTQGLRPHFYKATFAIIILINSFSIHQTLIGQRGQKQMNREAAAFIQANYSPLEYIIVLEPKGPLAFNLAKHLNADYQIAIDSAHNSALTPLYLDENLGLLFRENLHNSQAKAESNLIPFNGLNLYIPRQP